MGLLESMKLLLGLLSQEGFGRGISEDWNNMAA